MMKYFWVTFILLILIVSKEAQAQHQIDSLEKVLLQDLNEKVKLEVHLQLAQLYSEEPSDEALQLVEAGIELARKVNDTYSISALLKFKGEIFDELYGHEHEKVIANFQEALTLQKQLLSEDPDNLKVQKLLASTTNSLGYLYWKWGKLYESLYYYDSATRFSSKIWNVDSTDAKFVRLYGLQHNSKGAVLWGMGEYDEALTNYLNAYGIFERIGLLNFLSLISSNIGLIYDSWGQKEEALFYFKKAAALGQESNNPAAIGYAFSNVGRFMEASEKFDSASYYYQLSYEKYNLENNQWGIGLNLSRLGNLHIKLGEFSKALETFEKGLAIAEKNKANYWIALAQLNISKALKEMGEIANALRYANQCRELAAKYGYNEIMKDNYLNLSNIYSSKKDDRRAYENHVLYSNLKDSMFTEDRFKQITLMKERFEAEQKDKENELLRKDKLLQDQDLLRSRQVRMWLSLLLIVLVVFIIYFVISSGNIKKANKALQGKNDEITHQKEELGKQAEELKKSNEIKNLMFSIVSHDLRGPIGNLESMLKLLNNNLISQQEFVKRLPVLTQNVGQVNSLTDNLLYWAKSQIGGISVVSSVFDVFELVSDKFPLFVKSAEEKGIRICNMIPPNSKVLADPYMVELVFRNLISNAIKFCTVGQSITLISSDEGDQLKITVKDTGQGIPPEHIQKLFSGSIVTTMGTKNEKGVGIGLMICKHFVEVNGGEIWVESVYQQGTSFHFTLNKDDQSSTNSAHNKQHLTV